MTDHNDEAGEELSEVELRERARAARKAELKRERDKQRLIDLDAIEALELEYGDSNVAVLDVNWAPGLPTMIAARAPSEPEFNRFQHRIAKNSALAQAEDEDGNKGGKSNPLAGIKAAEEVADLVRIYPSDALYAELRKARPAIHAALGGASVRLVQARKVSEGKA